jgi:hypothetical protein
MKCVKDVVEWPPLPVFWGKEGASSAPLPELVKIQKVQRIAENKITVEGTFEEKVFDSIEERVVRYFLNAPDEKIADKLEKILKDNIGNPLLPVGDLEISKD